MDRLDRLDRRFRNFCFLLPLPEWLAEPTFQDALAGYLIQALSTEFKTTLTATFSTSVVVKR